MAEDKKENSNNIGNNVIMVLVLIPAKLLMKMGIIIEIIGM